MRDKSHIEQVERWAEFVRNNPRDKWKKVINLLMNATYQKADEFYKNLENTEEGRKILERLKKARAERK